MGILEDLQTLAANLLKSIGDAILDLINKIERFLQDIINAVVDFFRDAINRIVNAIESVFNDIINVISGFIDNILSTISTFISDAISFISNLIDDIIAGIRGFIDHALTIISDIFDTVVSNVIELTTDAANLFIDIFDKVAFEIGLLVDEVVLFVGDLFDNIKAGVGDIIDQAKGVVSSVVEAVDTFIRDVVDVIGNSLRDLLETISNLPDVINELAESIIQSAKENIAEPIIGLPMKLIEDLVEVASGAPLEEVDKMQNETLDMMFGRSPVDQTPEQMRKSFAKYMPTNPILKAVITLLVTPLMLVQIYAGIAQANSQIVLQEHALENPYRLMLPEDILRAKRFDEISIDTATTWLRKTGYTESVAKTLLDININLVPPGELVNWWLRKIIDDNVFDEGLKRQGWTDEDITRLRVAAFFVPPVQDLITMSVREVFTPEIAERFGQFEDFPPKFLSEAAKQGLSEEWAKNYWAAHWALPSVQMGFEMLHRGVIDESDLTLLLKSTDVMPFWRDKLVEISFSPLTRVDIRRMHKVGVLTEQEVNKAYHDIGYNDLNADRLTEFTLELNKSSVTDDDVGLGELTRSNIIRFFHDGVLDKQTAIEVLINTGVSQDAAELFIISAELQIDGDFRQDSIDLVIQRAKGGLIDFDQAQDELNRLGVEELEKQKALNKLLKEQAKRNKIPSKSDLDKFIKANLISDIDYHVNMGLNGWSRKWSDKFLTLAKGGRNADTE